MHFAETVLRRTFGKTVFAADLKMSKTTTGLLLRKGLENDKDLDEKRSLMLVLQLQVSLKNSYLMVDLFLGLVTSLNKVKFFGSMNVFRKYQL